MSNAQCLHTVYQVLNTVHYKTWESQNYGETKWKTFWSFLLSLSLSIEISCEACVCLFPLPYSWVRPWDIPFTPPFLDIFFSPSQAFFPHILASSQCWCGSQLDESFLKREKERDKVRQWQRGIWVTVTAAIGMKAFLMFDLLYNGLTRCTSSYGSHLFFQHIVDTYT